VRSLATVRISITDADQGITEQLNGESQESLCCGTLRYIVSHYVTSRYDRLIVSFFNYSTFRRVFSKTFSFIIVVRTLITRPLQRVKTRRVSRVTCWHDNTRVTLYVCYGRKVAGKWYAHEPVCCNDVRIKDCSSLRTRTFVTLDLNIEGCDEHDSDYNGLLHLLYMGYIWATVIVPSWKFLHNRVKLTVHGVAYRIPCFFFSSWQ